MADDVRLLFFDVLHPPSVIPSLSNALSLNVAIPSLRIPGSKRSIGRRISPNKAFRRGHENGCTGRLCLPDAF